MYFFCSFFGQFSSVSSQVMSWLWYRSSSLLVLHRKR